MEAQSKNGRMLDKKATLQAFESGDRVFYHTPVSASSKLNHEWKPYFHIVERVCLLSCIKSETHYQEILK